MSASTDPALLPDDIRKRAALDPLTLAGLRALRETLPERFAADWRPGDGCVVAGNCPHSKPPVGDPLRRPTCCDYGGELLGETITAPAARFIAAAGNLWDALLDRVELAECDRATLLRCLDEMQRELRQAEAFCTEWRERAWAAEGQARRAGRAGESVTIRPSAAARGSVDGAETSHGTKL